MDGVVVCNPFAFDARRIDMKKVAVSRLSRSSLLIRIHHLPLLEGATTR